MNLKTPLEKLVRLKKLSETIRNPRTPISEGEAAEREYRAILASVALPPLEMIGVSDSKAWAAAFTLAFPQFDTETAEHWFANAILAGADDGMREGHAQGKQYAAAPLVDLLRNIRDGLGKGIIRSNRLKVGDAEPKALEEIITETLTAAGLE